MMMMIQTSSLLFKPPAELNTARNGLSDSHSVTVVTNQRISSHPSRYRIMCHCCQGREDPLLLELEREFNESERLRAAARSDEARDMIMENIYFHYLFIFPKNCCSLMRMVAGK